MYGSREDGASSFPVYRNFALSDPNPNPKGLETLQSMKTHQAMSMAYERYLKGKGKREKALGRPLTTYEEEKERYVARYSREGWNERFRIPNRVYDLLGGADHMHPFSEENPPVSPDQCKVTPHKFEQMLGNGVREDNKYGDRSAPCMSCFISSMRIADRFASLLSDKSKESEGYVDLIHDLRNETLIYIEERKADKTYAPEPYIHYYDILGEGIVREFAKAVSDLDTDTVCKILDQLLCMTMMEQQSEQNPILKIAAEAIDKCMKNI